MRKYVPQRRVADDVSKRASSSSHGQTQRRPLATKKKPFFEKTVLVRDGVYSEVQDCTNIAGLWWHKVFFRV